MAKIATIELSETDSKCLRCQKLWNNLHDQKKTFGEFLRSSQATEELAEMVGLLQELGPETIATRINELNRSDF